VAVEIPDADSYREQLWVFASWGKMKKEFWREKKTHKETKRAQGERVLLLFALQAEEFLFSSKSDDSGEPSILKVLCSSGAVAYAGYFNKRVLGAAPRLWEVS